MRVLRLTIFLCLVTTSTGCSTLDCDCPAQGGTYVPETKSCLKYSSRIGTWFRDFGDCQKMAMTNFTIGGLTGRLAILDNDAIAHAAYWGINNKDPFIGMRSTKFGNATVIDDYMWWLDPHNINAVKPVTDVANVTSKNLVEANDECVSYETSATNKWGDRSCFRRLDAIGEIFVDQCQISDPCAAPKECIPDANDQTMCVCPLGAPNDPNCGAECGAKPDGDYPIGACTKHYYSCSGGTRTLQECSSNEVFDPLFQICNQTALACECKNDGMTYKYNTETQACQVRPGTAQYWSKHAEDCSGTVTDGFGIAGLYGRAVHLRTARVVSDVRDIIDGGNTNTGGKIKKESIGNASVQLSDYVWLLDRHNENAAETISSLDYITATDLTLNNQAGCLLLNEHHQLLSINCGGAYRTVCEIFYNQCAKSDPCIAPRQCVPDVNYQAKCFCPAGAVYHANCGVDCTAKLMAIMLWPLVHRITSLALEGHLHYTIVLMASSTSSCIVLDSLARNWYDGFKEICGSRAQSFGIGGLHGRLPLVTSAAIFGDVLDAAPAQHVLLGVKSSPGSYGNATDVPDFQWWLDADNPNAFDPLSSTYYFDEISTVNSKSECCTSPTIHSKLEIRPCREARTTACQIFYDECLVSDPCIPPKVCVPDVNKQARCFCPAGAVNDANCGADCNGKSDGNYAIGSCSKDYYTCSGGTPALQQCSDDQVFDGHLGICNDTWLGCKCIEENGKYSMSTSSCIVNMLQDGTWYYGVKSTCDGKTDNFGIGELNARLPLLTTPSIYQDVIDVAQGSDVYTGIISRLESLWNATEMSHYAWSLDADNPNAILPLSLTYFFESTLDFENPFFDCIIFETSQGRVRARPCRENRRIVCEIFYDQCSVSDPCAHPKVCVPDVGYQALCVCPPGTYGDANCGMDCSGKVDGDYAIGVGSRHYYICATGQLTPHSCPKGKLYHPYFKLCATEDIWTQCMNLGGKYIHSTESCLLLRSSNTWTAGFVACQTYVADTFGPGHKGRLVSVVNKEVITHAGDLLTSAEAWIGLRTDVLSNDINDYGWWQNPNNSTNSTPLDVDVLTGVSQIHFDSTADQCVRITGNHFYDELCSSYRKTLCEVLFDYEHDPVNICETEQPCQNSGICKDLVPMEGYYECNCTDDWTGDNCTDPNVCSLESPCQDGSNCTDGPGLEYSCDCSPDMLDKNCTVRDWCYTTRCANGGSCSNTDGYQGFVCNCTTNWLLPNCTQRAPQCPRNTNLRCNGSFCWCSGNLKDDQTEFREIGNRMRGSEGITVRTEERKSATHCAMVCGHLEECSFFSYKRSTGECLIHQTLFPALSEVEFKMFAKVMQ